MSANTPEKVQVAILGAGPGGATTSINLCQRGIPHVVLEKGVFPRDKICGDALSGKVVEVLNQLDPSFVKEIASRDPEEYIGSYGVKFAGPNGQFVDIPFKTDLTKLKDAPGFITKRIVFDNFLFNKIDRNIADVREGSTVTDVEQTPEGALITYSNNGETKQILADLVVGAEGDRSLVAKKLAKHKMDPKHYCGGLRAYYTGVTGFNENNFIELHFIDDLLPGYFWIFPLPNGEANVGVGMLTSKASSKNVNLKKAMLSAIENNPTIKDRFKNAELKGKIQGWGLPLGSKKRSISGDNYLLIGDAASLIDPFSGEGIGNALKSAMVAAEKIEEALDAGDFSASFLKAYDKKVYKQLWTELNLSHRMQQLGTTRWLLNLVINKAARSKTLQETITCMFEDIDMRSRLRSPRFYLNLIFN
ncbi:MAG: geranylgeranyl reductase family protein [Sphingobacteriales bacterium]|jgi:geranylgeranyl reductase family protein